jgi:peptidoglycan hydrolase-like protein with peptidoglycan-binding domain
MSVQIKAHVVGSVELRRFDLKPSPTPVSALRTRIIAAFPEIGARDFVITWKDEDGDWITMADDEDFALAAESVQGSVLRIQVTPASDEEKPSQKPKCGACPRNSNTQQCPRRGERCCGNPPPPPPPPNFFGAHPCHGMPFGVFVEKMRRDPPPFVRHLMEGLQSFDVPVPVAPGNVLPSAPLKIGSFGPGVAQLQEFLIEHGLMHPNAIRRAAGIYGPLTAKAILAFQQQAGVATADNAGVFDEVTRKAMVDRFRVDGDDNSAATPPQDKGHNDNAHTDSHPPSNADAASASAGASPPPENSGAPTNAENDDTKWKDVLDSLRAMGFVDAETLVPLVEQFKGSLDKVLSVLLDDAPTA